MQTTQFLYLLVTYPESFNLNTGKQNLKALDEEPSFTQSSMSSSLVFDSVNNSFCFRQRGESNSFGTVDYDAHIKKG